MTGIVSNVAQINVDLIRNKAGDGPPSIPGLSAVAWDGVDWDTLSVSTTDLSLDIQLKAGTADYEAETALVIVAINQADGAYLEMYGVATVGQVLSAGVLYLKTSATGRWQGTLYQEAEAIINVKLGILLPSGALLQSALVTGWETSD